jgi:hypothetical protein
MLEGIDSEHCHIGKILIGPDPSSGNQGQAVIRRLVEGAGAEVVAVAYRTRIERHAAEVAA